jgi:hypothetical protein
VQEQVGRHRESRARTATVSSSKTLLSVTIKRSGMRNAMSPGLSGTAATVMSISCPARCWLLMLTFSMGASWPSSHRRNLLSVVVT